MEGSECLLLFVISDELLSVTRNSKLVSILFIIWQFIFISIVLIKLTSHSLLDNFTPIFNLICMIYFFIIFDYGRLLYFTNGCFNSSWRMSATETLKHSWLSNSKLHYTISQNSTMLVSAKYYLSSISY